MLTGAYRDDQRLLVYQKSELPPYCIRCGQSCGAAELKKTYYWHPPALYFLILLGLLPYALVAVFFQRKIKLLVPLCETHRTQYRKGQLVGILVFVSAIPIAILLGTQTPVTFGWAFLLAITLLIAGAVIQSNAGSFLRPKYIDNEYAVFTGPGPDFLSLLQNRPPGSIQA